MSALVDRITEVLTGFRVNPSPAVCGCFDLTPEDAAHVAGRVAEALREDGIVGFIRNDAPLVPRVYTDADAEAWSDR